MQTIIITVTTAIQGPTIFPLQMLTTQTAKNPFQSHIYKKMATKYKWKAFLKTIKYRLSHADMHVQITWQTPPTTRQKYGRVRPFTY